MRRTLYHVVIVVLVSFPLFISSVVAADLQGRNLYRLQVEGMVCPFCAYNVERTLQSTTGVEYVDVNLEAGRVMVGMAPNHQLERQQAKAVIHEAGFTLESIDERPMSRDELRNTP